MIHNIGMMASVARTSIDRDKGGTFVRYIPQMEFLALLRANSQERCKYFINNVADQRLVWGLWDSQWLSETDESGATWEPYWPHLEYARHYKELRATQADIRPLTIEEFTDHRLKKIADAQLLVHVFPTASNVGLLLAPNELRAMIMARLEWYQ